MLYLAWALALWFVLKGAVYGRDRAQELYF
jgi:hypothetical protein